MILKDDGTDLSHLWDVNYTEKECARYLVQSHSCYNGLSTVFCDLRAAMLVNNS